MTTDAQTALPGLTDVEKSIVMLVTKRYTPAVAGCLEMGSDNLATLQSALTSSVQIQGSTSIQMAAVSQVRQACQDSVHA